MLLALMALMLLLQSVVFLPVQLSGDAVVGGGAWVGAEAKLE